MFSFKPVDLPDFVIPTNWVYRGEGNSNLVIALPDIKKILRIRKIHGLKSFFGWIIYLLTDLFKWYRGENYNEEIRDVEFYRKVMRPLLGNDYVCDAEPVFLSWGQVRLLEKQLSKHRPDFRKKKSLQQGRATLFEDYTLLSNRYNAIHTEGDTFSIEIKPKQGWTPFSEKHFPKCMFCMNQYLKLKNREIAEISSYCPSDLFSGDKLRMIRAIKALINNPQNNFRVFKNGKLVYGDGKPLQNFIEILGDIFKHESNCNGSIDLFCTIVQQCLIKNLEENQNICDKKLYCEWNAIIKENSLNNKLPRGCALEKILSVQMLDVEGIDYYYKLLGDKKFKDFDYVKTLIREIKSSKNTCLKCSIMIAAQSNKNLIYTPYLISAIAKDCSIMVTFKKISDSVQSSGNDRNTLNTKFGNFLVTVKLLDLYPKPLSTIRKHKKKITKLLQLDLGSKICYR